MRQVLIEARIVVVNDDFTRELGVRAGFTGIDVSNGGTQLGMVSGSAAATDTGLASALDNLANNGVVTPVEIPTGAGAANRYNVNLPVANPAGRLAFMLLGSDYIVDLELSAAQAEGRGEIISSPRVITANQREASILSPRGQVIVDERTNSLMVTETAEKLEELRRLIKLIDVPIRQVLIEARIVEASDTFGKSLGVKLGGGVNPPGGVKVFSQGGSALNTTFGSSYVEGAAQTTSGSFVNLPAIGQNGYNPASLAVSIFNSAANRFLSLELSALEADGKGRVVSSPRVVTADQIKALIEQGTELPYQVATSSGATSIAFRKANLKLEVTPQITPEGNIILDLDINKDSRGETTQAGIAINTKHIRTQVLVENGGTVVIGGIFELTETNDESKIPLLGDIPAVGNLFKTRTRTSNKQEMLVFITPKMIADKAVVR